MSPNSDKWLHAIYDLLRQALAPDWFRDYLLPIVSLLATLALAVAAVYVSQKARQAAETANSLATKFRDDEKAERLLAWRRALVSDLKDWDFYARFDALLGEPDKSTTKYLELRKRIDVQGDPAATPMLDRLNEDLASLRKESNAWTPEEAVVQRDGKHVLGWVRGHGDLFTEWLADPEGVGARLDDEKKNAARLSALTGALARLGNEGTQADGS